jgi:hypothetical protein
MRIHKPVAAQALACWNWKCALLSATFRSLVYLFAMMRGGPHNRLAVILVEIAYVTLTAGIYAGLQQKALGLRSRVLGNIIIVGGVGGGGQARPRRYQSPGGAPGAGRAIVAVSLLSAMSALFHLHVMRNGAFLSGHGHSLLEDFRRMPRLIAGFVFRPFALAALWEPAQSREAETEAAL